MPSNGCMGDFATDATAKTPYHRREHVRAKLRDRYQNMTVEDLEKKRAYDRAYRRRTRAAAVGVPTSPVKMPEPAAVPVTLLTAGKPAVAKTAKSAKPVARPQDLESYSDLSARKAQALQRAWKKEVTEYLLDVLTAPASPLTGAGIRSSKMLFLWMGMGAKLDRVVEQDRPDATAEYTLAVMLECLRRLTGEEKTTASAPRIG
jgi:hypothetical protein